MYIPQIEGKRIVREYQDDKHSKIGTEFRLYARSSSGQKVKLKAWWVSLADINQIIGDTNAFIASSGRTVSGLRFYPSLQDKNEQGQTVADYHALTYVATVQDSSGNQDNALLTEVMEFTVPCPNACNTIPSQELGY